RDVPGQLDDAFVVNVVQHMMEVPPGRPWRPSVMALYMGAPGRNTVRLVPQASGGFGSAPSAGDTRVIFDRSNGVDDMDGALIKPLRAGKPAEPRPAELDPSEFLAAAVRADQP